MISVAKHLNIRCQVDEWETCRESFNRYDGWIQISDTIACTEITNARYLVLLNTIRKL